MCKAVTAMLPKAAGRLDVYSTAESDPKRPRGHKPKDDLGPM